MRTFFTIIACIVLGPIFCWKGGSDLITGLRSRSWSTTQGTITSTDLTETRGRWGRRSYQPVIHFEYEVAGTKFSGNRLDLGGQQTSSTSEVAKVFARYPEGGTVTVHYNPKHPETALLEAGTKGTNWLLFLVGLVMTGAGVLAARSKWKDMMDTNIAPSSGF